MTLLDNAVTPAQRPNLPVDEPHLVLEPSTGWSALNLREVWSYRDLLWTLALRDIKLRYKQTMLGVLWVVLQPLIAAGIFTFVFSVVAGLKTGGKSPLVFSFAGLLAFNLFSNGLTRVSGCLVGNGGLISKVYFPRLVLPVATVPSTMLDFSVAAALLVVLMVAFPTVPTAAIVWAPVWILILLMLSVGAGLWAAALMVPYRDVAYILPVAVQMLMYASPVAYEAGDVTTKLGKLIGEQWAWVYYLNPLSGVLEGCKWSLIGTAPPPLWAAVYSAGVGVVLMVCGALVFKKMEKRFADVI